jgi:hypothetical protein
VTSAAEAASLIDRVRNEQDVTRSARHREFVLERYSLARCAEQLRALFAAGS